MQTKQESSMNSLLLNIFQLSVSLLPTFLRTPKTVAFVKSLVAPLFILHSNFYENAEENHYTLKHNGQVCYLRKALNDHFDITLRRIQIGDGATHAQDYLYLEAESNPHYLSSPLYLYTEEELEANSYDFRVILPTGLIYNEAKMRAIIEKYKLPSKRYIIEIV